MGKKILLKRYNHIPKPGNIEWKNLCKLTKKCLAAINKYIKTSNKYNANIIYDISEEILTNTACIMDVYALARMLHKYSKPPHNAKNIIVYAGDYHINVYRTFFREIGLKMKYSDCIVGKFTEKNSRHIVSAPPYELVTKLLKN